MSSTAGTLNEIQRLVPLHIRRALSGYRICPSGSCVPLPAHSGFAWRFSPARLTPFHSCPSCGTLSYKFPLVTLNRSGPLVSTIIAPAPPGRSLPPCPHSHPHAPSFTLSTWASCCFLNMPRKFPPQGLCSSYALFMQHSLPVASSAFPPELPPQISIS